MNLLCKIFAESYDNLWKAIIRPPRSIYSIKDLGPIKFELNSRNYKRTDLIINNKRNSKLKCSFWEPFDEEREYERLPCVIYLHGNSSSRVEAIGQLKYLLPLNITLFAFDFYGCGKSEGDYISLGWYESDDVECVINFLKKTNTVSTIGLWGRSMGAVTALMYASRENNNLSAILLDSAFYSLKKLIEELIEKNIKLPKFIINSMIQTLQKTIQEKANFDINDIEPFLFAQKCKIPAIFCHGKEDTFIDVHHCNDLYNIYPGEKNQNLFKGDHNTIRSEEFKKYSSRFFYNYLYHKNIKKKLRNIDNNICININSIDNNNIKSQSDLKFCKDKKFSKFKKKIKIENTDDYSSKYKDKEKNDNETLNSSRKMGNFSNCLSEDSDKINFKNKKLVLNKEIKNILRMQKNASESNLDSTNRIKLSSIELNLIKKLRAS